MKHFITIISLALFSQVSHAELDYRNICKYLKDNHQSTSNEVLIYNITESNASYKETLESPLLLAVEKFSYMSPDDAEDFCIDELKIISRAHAGFHEGEMLLKSAGSDIPSEPIPVDSAPATSEEMSKCQTNLVINAFECRRNSSFELPTNLEDILELPVVMPKLVTSIENPSYDKSECDCLEKNVKDSYAKQNFVKLEEVLDTERKRINDLIFNAAGKKIMNQFAANIEDVNFFRTNNVNAVGGDESSKALMCNNTEELKAATLAACKKNKVDPEKIKARVESLLGAFGDFKDTDSIAEKFNRLQDEILNIRLDPKKVDRGKSGTFSRSEYDQLRYGAFKGRPEVKFLNEATEMVLDNEILGPLVQQAIRQENKNPGHAIFRLLQDESNPEVKRVLSELVKKHKREPFYINLGVKLKSAADDLGKYVMDAYDLGTDMHPGLKAIYRDAALFDKVRYSVISKKPGSPDTHDMIAALESQPELLKTHFSGRCEKFKSHFTEAVCVPDDDFIARTNPDDLNKLLSPFSVQVNQPVKDLLICRMTKADSNVKGSVFRRLSFNAGDKLNQSDYWERKSQSGSSRPDRFSAIAKALESGNQGANQYFSQLSSIGRAEGHPAPEVARTLNEKKSVLNPSELASASESASQSTRGTLTDPALSGMQSVAPNMVPNYSAAPPVQLPSGNEVKATRDIKDTRSLLREFLANEENKQVVEQHLANTSDAETAVLLRIKEQIETDKLKMQELMSETEQLKLKSLQSQVKTLEQEYEEIAEEPSEVIQSHHSVSAATNVLAPSQANTASAGSGGGSARASVAGRGIASNAVSSNAVIAPVKDAAPITKSPQGFLVIDSGSVINGEIRPEVLNREVMSFVSLSSVDAEMLRQMKEKGVVLKFKTIEAGVEVLKEMKVEYSSFTPEVKQFLEKQIALKEKESELKAAQRAYSFNTLKQILGIRAQQSAN